jgi:hypothetical protein
MGKLLIGNLGPLDLTRCESVAVPTVVARKRAEKKSERPTGVFNPEPGLDAP